MNTTEQQLYDISYYLAVTKVREDIIDLKRGKGTTK